MTRSTTRPEPTWLRAWWSCKATSLASPNVDITANELGALAVTGVFDVAKEGGVGVTFAVGDKVYWDDGNDFAVATDGAGANKLLGKAVAAAADADTTVRVRLSQ